jgi:hypothetical protein
MCIYCTGHSSEATHVLEWHNLKLRQGIYASSTTYISLDRWKSLKTFIKRYKYLLYGLWFVFSFFGLFVGIYFRKLSKRFPFLILNELKNIFLFSLRQYTGKKVKQSRNRPGVA